ncbi:hypothetical protein BBF93_00315 [Hyphomonas sp. CACIAM 19H1]|nr:hypothetical protein BBF93_00315 [Hyphomonas sp. CACIAM 19H1]
MRARQGQRHDFFAQLTQNLLRNIQCDKIEPLRTGDNLGFITSLENLCHQTLRANQSLIVLNDMVGGNPE